MGEQTNSILNKQELKQTSIKINTRAFNSSHFKNQMSHIESGSNQALFPSSQDQKN